MVTNNSNAQASFENIGGLRYLIDSDVKTATVVASDDDKYSGDIAVPEKVVASDGKEYAVTAFGDEAFYECESLTSISIPSSVTSLGAYCFYYCHNLTSMTIPYSVASLGKQCFSECYGLTNITIPPSVTSLGNHCFSGCHGLTNVAIPSSDTSLEDGCFSNCHSLISVTIPSSVTFLGSQCFLACYSLNNIILPSSVKSLGESCFSSCSNLPSITIPSSVTSLGKWCFSNCTKLETITFKGKCPNNMLNCNLLSSCIIYVPKVYLQDYKDALGSKYSYIYASKEEGEEKSMAQCATPTITYAAGKLRFDCSIANVEYHYTITNADMATDAYCQDGIVGLFAAYNISVYATAEGYKPSEKTTATLYWINANLKDTTPTNINQAKTRGIIATSHDGIITLSGLDNNEEVRFYAADGKQIGRTTAIDGVASQAATSTSLVIAKIGGQSIKIAVR